MALTASTWTWTFLWVASRRTRLPCEHGGGWGGPDRRPPTLALIPDSWGWHPGGPSSLWITKGLEGWVWTTAVTLASTPALDWDPDSVLILRTKLPCNNQGGAGLALTFSPDP